MPLIPITALRLRLFGFLCVMDVRCRKAELTWYGEGGCDVSAFCYRWQQLALNNGILFTLCVLYIRKIDFLKTIKYM
jgi:hypothetical protein